MSELAAQGPRCSKVRRVQQSTSEISHHSLRKNRGCKSTPSKMRRRSCQFVLACYESSAPASQNTLACSRTTSNGRVYSRNLITPKGISRVVGLVWFRRLLGRKQVATDSSNGIADFDIDAKQSIRNGRDTRSININNIINLNIDTINDEPPQKRMLVAETEKTRCRSGDALQDWGRALRRPMLSNGR